LERRAKEALRLVAVGEARDRSRWARAPRFYLKKAIRCGLFYSDIIGVNRFVPGMIGQSTSFYMIRRECWEDLGGFDESFRCSYSDVDLCYRILFSEKWCITTCPHVLADHVGHATRGSGEECWRNFNGKDLYDRKWPHEKILEVVEASKRGKFVIPGVSQNGGEGDRVE